MPIKFAVLTISDRCSRGERIDASGPALVDAIQSAGWSIVYTAIIPDEYELIKSTLLELSTRSIADIVLTTGGTGLSPRDVTPEATTAVIDRPLPGLAEAMRLESLKITPHAMLSRSTAGIQGKTIIINLPGSTRAAVKILKS